LAYAATTTGVVLHAAVAMSNHYHLVLTDPHGHLPAFTACLNKLVAKCMNATLGRWENFWAGGEPTSYVRLLDRTSVVDKIVYTLSNPVAAGLVARGSEWPGLLLGKPGRYVFDRPEVFFREVGPMPASIELEVTAAPLGADVPPAEAWAEVEAAVDAKEAELRAEAAVKGLGFAGARAVRRQDPFDIPRTHEPRRTMSPRIASKNKWLRIEVLARCKRFLASYRQALEDWRARKRDVVFPCGTYGMRSGHGVLCAEA
jgi:hypothetical protein